MLKKSSKILSIFEVLHAHFLQVQRPDAASDSRERVRIKRVAKEEHVLKAKRTYAEQFVVPEEQVSRSIYNLKSLFQTHPS